MDERSAVITLRIDPMMKSAFERIAKELDLTSSQMLRQYIKKIVQQHAAANAQGALDLSPMPAPQPVAKKPAKGQKMASAKPANWRR